jgi:hypothetical protein
MRMVVGRIAAALNPDEGRHRASRVDATTALVPAGMGSWITIPLG